jgi:TolA-binding protein
MLRKIKYFAVFYVINLFFVANLQAQPVEDARKLYLEGKYAEALPIFEQLVKSSPKDASYNQWYGNCLLETGNPEKAEEFLQLAASKKITESYASLGKMYYLLYKFEQSVKAYTQYSEQMIKEKKIAETTKIDSLLQRSKRAARMLSHCEDIQIIDSIIVNKNIFLSAYYLSKESGSLENNEGRIIYENPLKNKRYFADKKENRYYRLYSEIKLQNKWSDKKELNLALDLLENNNYPFVLQDGLTTYFASTGSSSIGGYDLYVTRYNLNNDTYLTPNQLGMPFNSIANDYMMAIDEINNTGYFATDRFQPEDQVIIYTFIPNEEIISLKTDNEEKLISRAKIASIQDTWKSNVNYKAYLKQVKNNILKENMKTTKDFSFVINDGIMYHTLNDFKNDAAKQTFIKAQELEKAIDNLQRELDNLRLEYAKSNSNKKRNMRSNILSKEEHLYDLLNQYEQITMNIRNLEIKFIIRNS